MAVVSSRSWPRIFCKVASEIPFCKAKVANVCRKICGDTFVDSLARLDSSSASSNRRGSLTN